MPEMNDRAVSSAQAPPRLLQELRETLQRLRLGGPFYVLLWLLAGAAANLWLRFPVAFIAISLGFIGLTVVRFRVRPLPEDSGQVAVRRRLDYIWLLLLVNASLRSGNRGPSRSSLRPSSGVRPVRLRWSRISTG